MLYKSINVQLDDLYLSIITACVGFDILDSAQNNFTISQCHCICKVIPVLN